MTREARELLREALRLDIRERAEIAAELLASVDGEPDADAEAAWVAEIRRREERIRAGRSTSVDGDELRKQLEARYSKPA